MGGRTIKVTLSVNGTIILTPTIIQGNAHPLPRRKLRLTHKAHRARQAILDDEHTITYAVGMLVGLEALAGPRGHCGLRREGGRE